MARAIWSGSISFGLLNVPVKLYSAVARRGIALREIRESDSARIKHRRVAEGTDEEVPYEKIVKAYEITPDRYVPLSKDEMAALAPEKTRAIEVQDFVDIDEIDPIYFDSPYYLGPADGAEKAYSLLAAAMEGSGKVGDRPLRLPQQGAPGGDPRRRRRADPDHDALRRRGRAARPSSTTCCPTRSRRSPSASGEMAEQLIDSLTTDFDPGAYRDEYREQLLALIERKAEGKEIVAAGGRGAEGDQGARPDGGAGGEHRRGQGQEAAAKQARRKPKPKAPPRRAKRQRKPKSSSPRPKPKPRNRPWPERAGRSRSTGVS